MKDVTKKRFGPFYYKICVEKSREIALALRCFMPEFTQITYRKNGTTSNPIHPGMIFACVHDAVESALSCEELPVLRTTLRNVGHHIKFFRTFRDGDVVATVSRIISVEEFSGMVKVRVKTRTVRIKDNKLVCEGEWLYESKQ